MKACGGKEIQVLILLTLALGRDEVHLRCLILISVYTGCSCLTLP